MVCALVSRRTALIGVLSVAGLGVGLGFDGGMGAFGRRREGDLLYWAVLCELHNAVTP